jgi:hypothetical protein
VPFLPILTLHSIHIASLRVLCSDAVLYRVRAPCLVHVVMVDCCRSWLVDKARLDMCAAQVLCTEMVKASSVHYASKNIDALHVP